MANGFWRSPLNGNMSDIGRLGRFRDDENEEFTYGLFAGGSDQCFICMRKEPDEVDQFFTCEVFAESFEPAPTKAVAE